MRIEDIACETTGDRTRLSARLVWEDRERDPDALWYEWASSFRHDVSPSSAAMLVAALPLALVNGERRIAMAAPVCAYLYDHLRNVLGLFGAWYPRLTAPALEVQCQSAMPAPSEDRRAAVCLSGGVDSLAALAENHAALAPGHPERIRDAVYMFGLNTHDFENGRPVDERLAWNLEYGHRLREFCEGAGVSLIPVATNVRSLYADWASWTEVGQASGLAPAGHAMPRRIHALTIAGSGTEADECISGTEPSLDPLYSSYALDVRSVHGTLSRLEKIRMIASRPDALAVLRVCFTFGVPSNGMATETTNCGKCEKCIRTMLVLLVCDALHRTPTFPVRDVEPGMLAGLPIEIIARRQVSLYRALLDPLRNRGRDDLARALVTRLNELEGRQSPGSKSLVQRLLRR